MNIPRKWGGLRKLLLLVLLPALITGCHAKPPETGPPAEKQLRIVSLSPNITEIIYALGAGDNIVGVTSFCDYPPEAKLKTRVGGVLDTNFELILSLNPDIVIDLASQAERTGKLNQLGLKTVVISNETMDDLYESIVKLGGILGKQDTARQLVDQIKSRRNEIIALLEGVPRPTVAFVADHAPGSLQDVYVAGRGNFVNELIEDAGGVNVFADAGPRYPQVGLEAFLKLDPEYIFDATESGEDVYSSLPELKAVETGNVYFCFDEIIQVPGPRINSSLEYFARVLHPSAFQE